MCMFDGKKWENEALLSVEETSTLIINAPRCSEPEYTRFDEGHPPSPLS